MVLSRTGMGARAQMIGFDWVTIEAAQIPRAAMGGTLGKTGLMDREKLPAHARARLAEEEAAANAAAPLFKNGKATRPEAVKTPADLPKRWYGYFEQEVIARLSPLVPYVETRAYCFQLTLREWRKELARKAKKREAKNAAKGVGGLFGKDEK